MTKRIIWLFCLVIIGTGSAMAQGGGQGRTVEERVKMTMDTLNLNLKLDAAQSKSAEPIFTDYYKSMEALRQAGSPPDRAVMETKITERDEKLKKVFNADQFTQFKAWEQARRDRMRAQRGQ